MIVLINRTQSFYCTECHADTEVPRSVLGNPEAFAAMAEYLSKLHSNGCPVRLFEPVERLPETDWRIDILPLGVAQ